MTQTMNRTAVLEKVETKTKIAPPSKWKVVFLNDDITTMSFVMHILQDIFNYDHSASIDKMLEVHHKGKAVVGTYPKAVAEAKCQQCMTEARKVGYPFRAVTEEDNGKE